MAARTRGGAPNVNPVDDIDNDQDFDQDVAGTGRRRGWAGRIIAITLILVFVGGLTAIFAFNAFNIRDGHIFPPLRAVPVISNFIPEAEVIDYIYVNGYMVELPPAGASVAELEEAIALLTYELEAARAEHSQAVALNAQYEETVRIFQIYRDFITEYRESRRQFDEMIALGDPNAFATFYEGVEPENAARLFAQIRASQQVDREFRRYAATYHNMSTDAQAEVFSILLTQNPGLLISILETFNNVQRAEVFNEMEASDVAVITMLMEPDATPFGILPTVPLIDGAASPIPLITAAAPTPVVTPAPPVATADEDAEAAAGDDDDEVDV